MSRYKLRYFIAVGLLLALPAFTCGVGPVLRDLIQRVEGLETESALLTGRVDVLGGESDVLQGQVGSLADQSAVLEAENHAQQAEIDALAAAADAVPIVVDGMGEILGPVIGGEVSSVLTQIDLPGVPLFLLQVVNDDLIGWCSDAVEFESTDCTGQAWLDSSGMNTVWGKLVRTTDASDQNRLFYVGDPSDGPHPIVIRSTDGCGRGCEPEAGSPDQGFRATPVDLDAMFTPPFRVTTWERMQALP